MKLKSISGIICTVDDLGHTESFYEKLGFRLERKADVLKAYVNWFWLEFVVAPELTQDKLPDNARKGLGEFIYINVEDVQAVYDEVVALGLKPLHEPITFTSGRTEFGLADPDGYRLVFFSKK